MSLMPSTNKGSSLLGGIIMIAMLGAGGAAASASVPVPSQKPTPPRLDYDLRQKCLNAQMAAAQSPEHRSPKLVQRFLSKSPGGIIEKNGCVSAVLNYEEIRKATSGFHQQQLLRDPSTYKCVGEVSKVMMSAEGRGVIESTPRADIPAGTCETVFCMGTTCSKAKELSGNQSVQDWAILDPVYGDTLPEGTRMAFAPRAENQTAPSAGDIAWLNEYMTPSPTPLSPPVTASRPQSSDELLSFSSAQPSVVKPGGYGVGPVQVVPLAPATLQPPSAPQLLETKHGVPGGNPAKVEVWSLTPLQQPIITRKSSTPTFFQTFFGWLGFST